MKKNVFIVLLILFSVFPDIGQAAGIKVKIERPVIPVLVNKQINPTTKICLIGIQNTSCFIRGMELDLSGTTDVSDVVSIGLYGEDKQGNIDEKNRLCSSSVSSKKVRLVGNIPISNDSVSFWIAVTLKDTVSLDHFVQVNCREILTSRGAFNGGRGILQRVGIALQQAGQDGVSRFRIPGLATSNKGTLMAIFDARYDSKRDLQGNIDIALQRSFDKGETWQPMQIVLDMGEWNGLPQKYNGVSDACILVDKYTGNIYVAGLWMHGVLDENGKWIEGLTKDSNNWMHQWKMKGSQPGYGLRETSQFLITRSTDDGLTWNFPDDITWKTKPYDWWLLAPAPGKGITLENGTLLFPSQGRDEKGVSFSNITYSTDGGKTWKASNPAYHNVTECNAAQLTDGSIMLNMRDNRNRGNKLDNGRRICVTSDMGKTWTEHPASHKALIEPTCMGSLHKHEYTVNGIKKSILLFVNPSDYSVRDKITLKVSFDEGMSWPEKYWILLDQYKSSGYSSITSIDQHSIGILYESSQADLAFVKISLNEILKQK